MSALDVQVGGGHYKDLKIQPMEYSMANGLDACQHTIIKYVTRFRQKGGIQDLEKAKHCIDMLIEFEQAKTPAEPSADSTTARRMSEVFTGLAQGAKDFSDSLANPATPPCSAAVAQKDGGVLSVHLGEQPAEPAADIDDESPRPQAIAQDGNDGAVYADPWHEAPRWARFKAQDGDGEWRWYSNEPMLGEVRWVTIAGRAQSTGVIAERNSEWAHTLIERPAK